MSRLIVVSNRVADLEKAAQSGGLAVALGDALQQLGGLWFGWDGNIVAEGVPLALNVSKQGSVTTATMPLSQKDYEQYYLGFANRVLWPVLHYRLDLAAHEGCFVEGYRRVNARFADSIIGLVAPGDLIWVHDYHLFPLATELRLRGLSERIGFFLHVPFPPPEIILAVPEHEWLVRTFFSYDVVGFQTANDVSNFRRYVVGQAGGTAGPNGQTTAFGRTITVRSFPIGIDADAFAEMARTPEAEARIQRLHQRTLGQSQVVGVDRLDYTKGLPERLKAFRRLLELYPENRKRVTLMQIAPPTREEVEAYSDIRQELEALSGAINGEFGDFDWTPVRYIHRTIARDTLAALFRASRVGLVTPLRDGMNLVAKEYVAAQDEDDPGVLVLSQFAGAAEDLEDALVVNPYDTDQVAKALQRALVMKPKERVERYRSLIARVREHDADHWCNDFLSVLRNTRLQSSE